MLPPEDFDIRFSELEDLENLSSWLTLPQERDPFPFETDAETEEALKNWIGFARYKSSLTGVLSGVPCAIGTLFLMPYRKVAHHASFYLIVDPKHRKQGIGGSMIKNLLHLAKTRFLLESVHAEIFEPSSLISILEKQHFETFARQEGFVKREDTFYARVLMEHFLHE